MIKSKTGTQKRSTTNLRDIPVSPIDVLCRKLDEVAHEMELKWGAGTLFNLCKPETAAKWTRVNDALSDALRGGDYDLIRAKTESLAKGWRLMEQEALEAGHKVHPDNVWYACAPQTGIEYIFCKSSEDALRIARVWPERASAIFTLANIAAMLENGSLSLYAPKAKEAIAKAAKTPTGKFLDDAIPF